MKQPKTWDQFLDAVEIANKNQTDDPEWTYTAVPHKGKFIVLIYDEDKRLVGTL